MAKKKIPKKKEKVTEIFEVGDKEIIKESVSETPVIKKGQDAHQTKILRNILIIVGLIIAITFGGYLYIKSLQSPSYDGIEFTTVQEGQLIFYKTTLELPRSGKVLLQNMYLRTNPRDLKKINFERESYSLMKFSVINYTNEFRCNDGDEVIAQANLAKLHEVFGMQIMKDENATCDEQGRYAYYNFLEGDKTKIEKIGEVCYNVYISDCEILPAMEKIMVEMMVDYNKK